MKIEDLQKRIDGLISLAENVLTTTTETDIRVFVSNELFNEFRSLSLSFLEKIFGNKHTYYTEFNTKVKHSKPSDTKDGLGILKAVKQEIDNGWLFSLKSLVSAEIFTDFLEMANYLLKENYKDASAVMIGSVLEEHLRQLCLRNSIPTETIKDGKPLFKKADLLNSELASTEIYNKLDQKSITSWLDLRNKAAHGQYNEYTKDQVELMCNGVTNFISRSS